MDDKSTTLRLDCDHYIHDRCLADHMRESDKCKTCTTPYFQGYTNAMQEHVTNVRDAEKKQEKKEESNPDSYWSFGKGLELTGKNCTNATEKKSNVSKSGVPKKLPKRTGSISRPDVNNNNNISVSQSQNLNSHSH